MFAIVASSFALAVYMVKLLKELVEPSDIFLQCLRSHLSVPSTEVRGRGPVSRRHRDHAICVGKGSTRGFDIRISSKCCLRKGFFCPKHPRCYEPRQSSQSVDWTETLASVATWMVLIVVSAFAIIAYSMYASTPRKRSDVHSRPISPTWNEETEEEVYPPHVGRLALRQAYRLLRALGFEIYGIRAGSPAARYHHRYPERVVSGRRLLDAKSVGHEGHTILDRNSNNVHR
ncbi:uncharacterized protein [Dermacentor andersoni]|uniref:uncharacterized protein isoform X5 n=1 Tax=Dermacentor andersoni TaxID=34620 RepID=UPI002418067B|nr:uncharacterized protein LOC129382271 isoform X6 [Dermacentor andersoni]